ncbi:trimeric intracellular cation channel family protein [uncultured Cohaesibacter sp.]|uniref:trimeric intracellular cation channel family protein n=1 Tax=uncultured Cohaesibacter sp. TaxID=1002546 RepID=UPI002930CF42|nr:trimeric intracellular cation channel family protein [uncultured Cohaesibacter sp.]
MSVLLSLILDKGVPIFFYAGLVVFAMSGGLRAIQAQMDLFGVLMVGLVTATGGGTIRDILIGSLPVNWVADPGPLAIVLPSSLLAYGVHHLGWSQRQIFNWVDGIGMAIFSVTGAAITAKLGHHEVICIMMGVVTATFGSLIRDILCNVVPFLLRQEIYATAALLGATLYVGLQMLGVDEAISALIGMSSALTLRGMAIRYKFNVREVEGEEPPQIIRRD